MAGYNDRDPHRRIIPSYPHPPYASVQTLWIGDALPPMQQLAIRSFQAHGHAVELFTYGATERIPEGTIILPAESVIPRESIYLLHNAGRFSGSYAAFSDLFRYKLLLERGGWWVDLDMICLRSFCISESLVFASQRSRKRGWTAATCVIRAPAGTDLIAECYERARFHVSRDTSWGVIGPTLLHDVIQRHKMSEFIKPVEAFCPIDWWRAEDLLLSGDIPTGSYAIHLWNEIWRQSGWKKEPIYPTNTIYQKLHLKYPPISKTG
jgi:hypothetical protein